MSCVCVRVSLCSASLLLLLSALTCTCPSSQQSEQPPKDMSHPCAPIKDSTRDNSAAFHSQRSKNEVRPTGSSPTHSSPLWRLVSVAFSCLYSGFTACWRCYKCSSTETLISCPVFRKWDYLKILKHVVHSPAPCVCFTRWGCITTLTATTAALPRRTAWSSLSPCLEEWAVFTEVRTRNHSSESDSKLLTCNNHCSDHSGSKNNQNKQ